MDRRSVLKTVSILLGGAMSAGTVSAVMSGCTADTSSNWVPQILSKDQAKMLAEVVDIILPATNTPGAKELLVHRFMDKFIAECLSKDEQDKVLKGFETINAASLDVSGGKDFVKASPEDRLAVLSAYDKASAKDGSHFFRSIKGLAIMGYFSTEVGQTKALQHIAVPGRYEGCIPLAEAGEGRSWAQ
jgi:hypothetical protein